MKRRKFSAEFKRETAKYIIEQELSIAAASRKFGVGATALSRWVAQYQDDPDHAFPGHGKQKPQDQRIRELEEENRRLHQEREILKKATAFFAKDVK